MTDSTSILTAADEREVVTSIARRALEVAAPDELVLFDDTTADYFRNPHAALDGRDRDESVGFGLDMAMVTPYLIAMATSAVQLLGTIVRDAVQQEGTAAAAALIRRLFRLSPRGVAAQQPAPAPLSVEQARYVRDGAVAKGRALGLDDDKATLLADAIVGGLVVAG
jgi:hypothetical protein